MIRILKYKWLKLLGKLCYQLKLTICKPYVQAILPLVILPSEISTNVYKRYLQESSYFSIVKDWKEFPYLSIV